MALRVIQATAKALAKLPFELFENRQRNDFYHGTQTVIQDTRILFNLAMLCNELNELLIHKEIKFKQICLTLLNRDVSE